MKKIPSERRSTCQNPYRLQAHIFSQLHGIRELKVARKINKLIESINRMFFKSLVIIFIFSLAATLPKTFFAYETQISPLELVGLYHNHKLPSSLSNLTAKLGETVHFNCSLAASLNYLAHSYDLEQLNKNSNNFYNRFQASPSSLDPTALSAPSSNFERKFSELKFNPTWLKADPIYNQNGIISGFKTENIIVTRKGIIADQLSDKMKLISVNDQTQMLHLNNLNVRNEGKYICREFNSNYDKQFILNVYGKLRQHFLFVHCCFACLNTRKVKFVFLLLI
jgi:hypothetical protein